MNTKIGYAYQHNKFEGHFYSWEGQPMWWETEALADEGARNRALINYHLVKVSLQPNTEAYRLYEINGVIDE